MAVPRDYLARVLAALDAPGVGAGTCLYRGRGDAGFWSRFAAAGPSWQFLAALAVGIGGKFATPCMGSTIALRRETLAAIGGFAVFADILADDHAIGQAIGAQGLAIAVPPLLLAHAHDDSSFGAVWRHELRWAATVRGVAPAGYAGSIVAYPVPLAILAVLVHPAIGLWVALGALLARFAFAHAVDTRGGERPLSCLWLPARDILSFAVFLASFFARSVDWRGASLRMASNGTIVAGPENSQ
uniref:glycosyltransferase n=1 Tax=uncultured Sphingomonas sp. TaxID=158754 RepID=UPI0035CB097A